MFGLSGIRCAVCGMALENDKYTKDIDGESIYWANPKLTPHTDVVLNFCGAIHSYEWYKSKVEASMNVTPVSDQSAD